MRGEIGTTVTLELSAMGSNTTNSTRLSKMKVLLKNGLDEWYAYFFAQSGSKVG